MSGFRGGGVSFQYFGNGALRWPNMYCGVVRLASSNLRTPSQISLVVSVDVKHHVYVLTSELRSCVKVEVAVLVPNSSCGLCEREATLNLKSLQSSGAV